jgi:hypothetical protein
MRGLTQHKAVNARMVSKLHVSIPYLFGSDRQTYGLSQDIFELRERRWVPRRATASPMTIAQVHEAVSSSAKFYNTN